MWPRVDGLRAFTLGSPGAMQDDLNARTLAGTKVATAGLLQQDYLDDGESVDEVGERQVLIDEAGNVLATVEITRVEQHRFADVPWEFADAEGEDFRSIEHWRDGHRSFYERCGISVDDDTMFVCTWFRIVERP